MFATLGENFTYSAATNLFQASNGGVVTYSSPFSFNLGGTATSTLYVKEDGIVSFGTPLASGGFTAVADLARLGMPLIAPFYANLNQNSRTAVAAGFAGIVIQQGIADPFPDSGGSFALTEAKTALRITWYGFDVTDATGTTSPVYTQLLLIDEGNGDFDFKIRAGAPGTTAGSPAGGIGGFVFGGNDYQYATPYDATSAGTFSVRGGEIVSLVAAAPEPATWAMMVLGFGLAGGAIRRRGGVGRAAVRLRLSHAAA